MTADMLLYAPADLIEVDQWVLWCHERQTKVPYQVNGKKASTADLSTWNTYDTVFHEWRKYPKHYAGVGFVFSEHDPFCGIDLDNSLDEAGAVKAWARGIVERFSDTYIEISPSGRGIKIWSKAKLPAAVGKVVVEDGGIEIYDRRRYFTVTGRKFRGAPDQIEDHAADMMVLYERLSGRRGPQHEVSPEGKIQKGTQHLTLVSLAGTLRRRGVCEQAIEACLQAVNRHQCEEPGPPANISKIVASTRIWRRP